MSVLCFTLLCPQKLGSSPSGLYISLQNSLLKIQTWPLGASPCFLPIRTFLSLLSLNTDPQAWEKRQSFRSGFSPMNSSHFQQQEPIKVIGLKLPLWTSATITSLLFLLSCSPCLLDWGPLVYLVALKINHCSLKWWYLRNACDYRTS